MLRLADFFGWLVFTVLWCNAQILPVYVITYSGKSSTYATAKTSSKSSILQDSTTTELCSQYHYVDAAQPFCVDTSSTVPYQPFYVLSKASSKLPLDATPLYNCKTSNQRYYFSTVACDTRADETTIETIGFVSSTRTSPFTTGVLQCRCLGYGGHCYSFGDNGMCQGTWTTTFFVIPITPLCSEFACSNGTCLAGVQVCDGVSDCESGEDESPSTCCTAKSTHYWCKQDQVCISVSQFCDGVVDCPVTGEDELTQSCGLWSAGEKNKVPSVVTSSFDTISFPSVSGSTFATCSSIAASRNSLIFLLGQGVCQILRGTEATTASASGQVPLGNSEGVTLYMAQTNNKQLCTNDNLCNGRGQADCVNKVCVCSSGFGAFCNTEYSVSFAVPVVRVLSDPNGVVLRSITDAANRLVGRYLTCVKADYFMINDTTYYALHSDGCPTNSAGVLLALAQNGTLMSQLIEQVNNLGGNPVDQVTFLDPVLAGLPFSRVGRLLTSSTSSTSNFSLTAILPREGIAGVAASFNYDPSEKGIMTISMTFMTLSGNITTETTTCTPLEITDDTLYYSYNYNGIGSCFVPINASVRRVIRMTFSLRRVDFSEVNWLSASYYPQSQSPDYLISVSDPAEVLYWHNSYLVAGVFFIVLSFCFVAIALRFVLLDTVSQYKATNLGQVPVDDAAVQDVTSPASPGSPHLGSPSSPTKKMTQDIMASAEEELTLVRRKDSTAVDEAGSPGFVVSEQSLIHRRKKKQKQTFREKVESALRLYVVQPFVEVKKAAVELIDDIVNGLQDDIGTAREMWINRSQEKETPLRTTIVTACGTLLLYQNRRVSRFKTISRVAGVLAMASVILGIFFTILFEFSGTFDSSADSVIEGYWTSEGNASHIAPTPHALVHVSGSTSRNCVPYRIIGSDSTIFAASRCLQGNRARVKYGASLVECENSLEQEVISGTVSSSLNIFNVQNGSNVVVTCTTSSAARTRIDFFNSRLPVPSQLFDSTFASPPNPLRAQHWSDPSLLGAAYSYRRIRNGVMMLASSVHPARFDSSTNLSTLGYSSNATLVFQLPEALVEHPTLSDSLTLQSSYSSTASLLTISPDVLVFTPQDGDTPVGFLYGNDLSRAVGADAARYYGISGSYADVGFYMDQKFGSFADGVTISLYLQATNVTLGFAFAVTDARENILVKTSPLLERLAAILSNKNEREWFNQSANVYAALYVNGPAAKLNLVYINSPYNQLGNKTKAFRSPLVNLEWDLAALGLGRLFNGAWHLVNIILTTQSGTPRAQLLVDGVTSFSARGWNLCVPRTPLPIQSLAIAVPVGVASVTQERFQAGGVLFIGYLNAGGVAKVEFEPLVKDIFEIFLEATGPVRSLNYIDTSGYVALGIVLIMVGAAFLAAWGFWTGLPVLKSMRSAREKREAAAFNQYAHLCSASGCTPLSRLVVMKVLDIDSEAILLLCQRLMAGGGNGYTTLALAIVTSVKKQLREAVRKRGAWKEKPAENDKVENAEKPENATECSGEEKTHENTLPQAPATSQSTDKAVAVLDQSEQAVLEWSNSKPITTEVWDAVSIVACRIHHAESQACDVDDISRAVADHRSKHQAFDEHSSTAANQSSCDGHNAGATKRQQQHLVIPEQLTQLLFPLAVTLQSIYVWQTTTAVPKLYQTVFRSFLSFASADVASAFSNVPQVATLLLQLFIGLIIVCALYSILFKDEQLFLWYLGRYAINRDQVVDEHQSEDIRGSVAPAERLFGEAAVKDFCRSEACDWKFAVPVLADAVAEKLEKLTPTEDDDDNTISSVTDEEEEGHAAIAAPKEKRTKVLKSEDEFVLFEHQHVQYVARRKLADEVAHDKKVKARPYQIVRRCPKKAADGTTTRMPLEMKMYELGLNCCRHQGRLLTYEPMTDAWPTAEMRPSCSVAVDGAPCQQRPTFICGKSYVSEENQPARCSYALCTMHFQGGVVDSLLACEVLPVVRDAARYGVSWTALFIFIVLGNLYYTPFLRTAQMVLSCHPYYQCAFESCWGATDVNFTIASQLSLSIIFFYGLGFPVILFLLLRRRMRQVHSVFFSPEYGDRFASIDSEEASAEWKRLTATDFTVLGSLYKCFSLRWMLIAPMLLVWKAALLAPPVFIETGTIGQSVGVAMVEISFGAFWFIANPCIVPSVDAMYKVGIVHQMLFLGLQNIDVHVRYHGKGSTGIAMVILTALYLVISIGVIAWTKSGAVRHVLKRKQTSAMLKRFGVRDLDAATFFVIPRVAPFSRRREELISSTPEPLTVVNNDSTRAPRSPVKATEGDPVEQM